MKLFLSGLDLVGFTALSTSAVVVALVSSLLRLTLSASLRLKEKASENFRRLRSTEIVSVTQAQKNGSNWLIIRLWKFSFLVGVKEGK